MLKLGEEKLGIFTGLEAFALKKGKNNPGLVRMQVEKADGLIINSLSVSSGNAYYALKHIFADNSTMQEEKYDFLFEMSDFVTAISAIRKYKSAIVFNAVADAANMTVATADGKAAVSIPFSKKEFVTAVDVDEVTSINIEGYDFLHLLKKGGSYSLDGKANGGITKGVNFFLDAKHYPEAVLGVTSVNASGTIAAKAVIKGHEGNEVPLEKNDAIKFAYISSSGYGEWCLSGEDVELIKTIFAISANLIVKFTEKQMIIISPSEGILLTVGLRVKDNPIDLKFFDSFQKANDVSFVLDGTELIQGISFLNSTIKVGEDRKEVKRPLMLGIQDNSLVLDMIGSSICRCSLKENNGGSFPKTIDGSKLSTILNSLDKTNVNISWNKGERDVVVINDKEGDNENITVLLPIKNQKSKN